MAIDRSVYFQNVRVWSRRMNVTCDQARAEKALGLMGKMNLSESMLPLVCVFFCLQKDRGDKNLELALKLSMVAARAVLEITRGNFASGTDGVSVFTRWVETKTKQENTWMSLVVTAGLNRTAVNKIVADAIHARNEEKAQPSLGNLLVANLHRQMRGQTL